MNQPLHRNVNVQLRLSCLMPEMQYYKRNLSLQHWKFLIQIFEAESKLKKNGTES